MCRLLVLVLGIVLSPHFNVSVCQGQQVEYVPFYLHDNTETALQAAVKNASLTPLGLNEVALVRFHPAVFDRSPIELTQPILVEASMVINLNDVDIDHLLRYGPDIPTPARQILQPKPAFNISAATFISVTAPNVILAGIAIHDTFQVSDSHTPLAAIRSTHMGTTLVDVGIDNCDVGVDIDVGGNAPRMFNTTITNAVAPGFIRTSSATLHGVHISNSARGLIVLGDSTYIRDSSFFNTTRGIALRMYGNRNTIRDSEFTSNFQDIEISNCKQCLVSSNTMSNTQNTSIVIRDSNQTTIEATSIQAASSATSSVGVFLVNTYAVTIYRSIWITDFTTLIKLEKTTHTSIQNTSLGFDRDGSTATSTHFAIVGTDDVSLTIEFCTLYARGIIVKLLRTTTASIYRNFFGVPPSRKYPEPALQTERAVEMSDCKEVEVFGNVFLLDPSLSFINVVEGASLTIYHNVMDVAYQPDLQDAWTIHAGLRANACDQLSDTPHSIANLLFLPAKTMSVASGVLLSKSNQTRVCGNVMRGVQSVFEASLTQRALCAANVLQTIQTDPQESTAVFVRLVIVDGIAVLNNILKSGFLLVGISLEQGHDVTIAGNELGCASAFSSGGYVAETCSKGVAEGITAAWARQLTIGVEAMSPNTIVSKERGICIENSQDITVANNHLCSMNIEDVPLEPYSGISIKFTDRVQVGRASHATKQHVLLEGNGFRSNVVTGYHTSLHMAGCNEVGVYGNIFGATLNGHQPLVMSRVGLSVSACTLVDIGYLAPAAEEHLYFTSPQHLFDIQSPSAELVQQRAAYEEFNPLQGYYANDFTMSLFNDTQLKPNTTTSYFMGNLIVGSADGVKVNDTSGDVFVSGNLINVFREPVSSQFTLARGKDPMSFSFVSNVTVLANLVDWGTLNASSIQAYVYIYRCENIIIQRNVLGVTEPRNPDNRANMGIRVFNSHEATSIMIGTPFNGNYITNAVTAIEFETSSGFNAKSVISHNIIGFHPNMATQSGTRRVNNAIVLINGDGAELEGNIMFADVGIKLERTKDVHVVYNSLNVFDLGWRVQKTAEFTVIDFDGPTIVDEAIYSQVGIQATGSVNNVFEFNVVAWANHGITINADAFVGAFPKHNVLRGNYIVGISEGGFGLTPMGENTLIVDNYLSGRGVCINFNSPLYRSKDIHICGNSLFNTRKDTSGAPLAGIYVGEVTEAITVGGTIDPSQVDAILGLYEERLLRLSPNLYDNASHACFNVIRAQTSVVLAGGSNHVVRHNILGLHPNAVPEMPFVSPNLTVDLATMIRNCSFDLCFWGKRQPTFASVQVEPECQNCVVGAPITDLQAQFEAVTTVNTKEINPSPNKLELTPAKACPTCKIPSLKPQLSGNYVVLANHVYSASTMRYNTAFDLGNVPLYLSRRSQVSTHIDGMPMDLTRRVFVRRVFDDEKGDLELILNTTVITDIIRAEAPSSLGVCTMDLYFEFVAVESCAAIEQNPFATSWAEARQRPTFVRYHASLDGTTCAKSNDLDVPVYFLKFDTQDVGLDGEMAMSIGLHTPYGTLERLCFDPDSRSTMTTPARSSPFSPGNPRSSSMSPAISVTPNSTDSPSTSGYTSSSSSTFSIQPTTPVAADGSTTPIGVAAAIVGVLAVVAVVLIVVCYCRTSSAVDDATKNSVESQFHQMMSLAQLHFQNKYGQSFGSSVQPQVPLYPAHNVELLDTLGTGAFAVVRLGRLIDQGTQVAVKTPTTILSSEELLSFLLELLVMCRLDHQNIVRVLGVSFIKDKPSMVLELARQGNLRDYLRQHPNTDRTMRIKWLEQVASAMEYLSSLKILHRDLAARNVLLMNVRRVKLSDFGLSRFVNSRDEQYISQNNLALPYRWMAPECLHHNTYSTASDVWAFGILTWEVMHSGATPFSSYDHGQLSSLFSTQRHNLTVEDCKAIQELFEYCLDFNPVRRPVFAQIVSALHNSIDSVVIDESRV
eukprot:m.361549 g.361549  ORF g.361549 m.361549 type:complete len:1966 (-) comp19668_c0_seq1:307-6204(-)